MTFYQIFIGHLLAEILTFIVTDCQENVSDDYDLHAASLVLFLMNWTEAGA